MMTSSFHHPLDQVSDDVIDELMTSSTDFLLALKGVFEVENDDEDQKQTPLLQFLQDLQLDDYYDLFLVRHHLL